MALDAGRRDLFQQRRADLVLGDLIVADDDALAVRRLRPDCGDLTVDQAVIDSC